MSAAIKKVEGVESATVSLNQGSAVIAFRPSTRATVEQIREIVRRNGFTPKAADVKVAGKLVQHEGRPALAVTGTDAVYLLAEHPDAKDKLAELQQVAKEELVVVSGHMPETPEGPAAPLTLQVREFAVEQR